MNEKMNEVLLRTFLICSILGSDNEISSLEIPLQSVFIYTLEFKWPFSHSNLLESVIST